MNAALLSPVEVFSTWCPVEICKASEAPESTPRKGAAKTIGYVKGWMSLPNVDRQGDIIVPTGLDVTWFRQDGWFNSDHSRDHLDKVGYPTVVELRDHAEYGQGWWTEGPIIDTPLGRRVVEFGKAIEGTDRELGFSIQGPPPVRDPVNPKRIVKASVWDVAVTTRPVNELCRLELVKSLGSVPGLAAALTAFAATNPDEARAVWDFVKSMTAAAPTANVSADPASPDPAQAGAVLQFESIAGKPKRRKRKRRPLLSLDEARDVLAKSAAITPEMAALALAMMARSRTARTAAGESR